MALAVGIGTLLPAGAEMIYQNEYDPSPSRILSIPLQDVSRGLSVHLTPRFELNTLGKWSPDGKQIVYLNLTDAVYHVYLMDALGRNRHPVNVQFTTLDSGYVWSPDSRYILFSVTNEGLPQILVLDVTTGQAYSLPQLIGDGFWSADSQNILYQAATEDGITHLYAMNIKCLVDAPSCLFHQLDMLAEQTTYESFAWSPDGKAFVFTQGTQPDTQIVVGTLRCGDLTDACVDKTTVVGKGPLIRSPIWSPDSKQIAYVYDTQTIQTVEIATGKTHLFKTPDILPILKDWSPDGRYIAYFSAQGSVINVYLLDVISGDVRPLFPDQPTTNLPEWRPIPR